MDAFSTAFAATFKAAAKARGMTVVATITSAGDTADFDVGFIRPGMLMLNGQTRSTEYRIELLDPADVPDLDEGDTVVIGSETFRVREAPYCDDPGADGSFRYALLTKTA